MDKSMDMKLGSGFQKVHEGSSHLQDLAAVVSSVESPVGLVEVHPPGPVSVTFFGMDHIELKSGYSRGHLFYHGWRPSKTRDINTEG